MRSQIIVTFLLFSFSIFNVEAAPRKPRAINSLSEISNEKEAEVFIQNRIDEVLNASSLKNKKEKLSQIYKTAKEQSETYTTELTRLFIELDQVDLQLQHASSNALLMSKSDLEANINKKQILLNKWNEFFVGFQQVFKLFLDKDKPEDLTCETISHKIYFDNNSNLPDGSELPPMAKLAQRVALDMCNVK